MLAPGSVVTGNHEMYKVFTPYKNAFLRRLKEELPAVRWRARCSDGGRIRRAACDIDVRLSARRI
jgi:deoxyribodipyrimidine photo-lyase